LDVDAILQEATIQRSQQKPSTRTNGLGLKDAYGGAWLKLGAWQGKTEVWKATLMWIPHLVCPFKAQKLCHTLAIEIRPPNPNIDKAPSIEAFLTCCQGLIPVDGETSDVD